jgi:hypothetical protein
MRLIHRGFFSLIIVLLLVGLAVAQAVKYTVQFEAAPTKEAAEEKVKQLEAKDVQAYIVKSFIPGKGTFYRVRAGLFPNQNEAKKFGADLQRRGVVNEFFIATYEKPTEDLVASAPAKTAPTPVPKGSQVKPQSTATPPSQSTPNNAQVASKNNVTNPGKPATEPAHNPPANPQPNAAVGGVPAKTTPAEPTTASPAATSPAKPARSASSADFVRFIDPKIGFSFEHPSYWTGEQLSAKEATDQRVNAGALFKSHEDAAFLNAIWNELEKANNPANDNDLIVEVILKSMQSGDGTQLQEVSRKVETENGLIKTYLDLKAAFQTQGQSTALDFLGKAVIIRAARGILLVVAFYSKDAPPNAVTVAERIIASVRAPE